MTKKDIGYRTYLYELNLDYNKFNLNESDFVNHSDLHGIMHTFRVMYNVLLLGYKLNDIHNTKISFYAAYIHDLSRRHDGFCELHGLQSLIENFDKYKHLFDLNNNDLDALRSSVKYHSLSEEINKDHKHYKPIIILKDADALDRVRLDDLNPNYLRFDESKKIIKISENLFYSNLNKQYNNFHDFLYDNLVY